MNIYCYQ